MSSTVTTTVNVHLPHDGTTPALTTALYGYAASASGERFATLSIGDRATLMVRTPEQATALLAALSRVRLDLEADVEAERRADLNSLDVLAFLDKHGREALKQTLYVVADDQPHVKASDTPDGTGHAWVQERLAAADAALAERAADAPDQGA